MWEFREITIPGDVLDDDRISATAKILYGKIARLAYKSGYCWASNKFLDGTQSGNTASHNIKELEKCGYIICIYENSGQDRKIYICSIDSRVKKNGDPPHQNGEDPPPQTVRPPTANGETPPPQTVNEQYKINKEKEQAEKQEEKTESPFSFSPTLSESLNPNMADFSQRLELLRGRYNDLKIGPPFRKTALNLSPPELSDLMKIMRVYPDDVSLGAMENYSKITNSPDHDPGGCVYRGFVSFMARGVEKYCGEAGPFELFRKKPGRYGGSSPPGGDWADFGEVSQGTVDIEALYRKFGITGTGPEKRRKLIELRDRGEVLF